MAFIAHDPLSPVPFVDVLFVIGNDTARIKLYRKIMEWAKNLGAREVRVREEVADGALKKVCENLEERKTVVLLLG